MILYNNPAEKSFWRIVGNLRPAEHSLSPTHKSAYNEQGFFFIKDPKIYGQKILNASCVHIKQAQRNKRIFLIPMSQI